MWRAVERKCYIRRLFDQYVIALSLRAQVVVSSVLALEPSLRVPRCAGDGDGTARHRALRQRAASASAARMLRGPGDSSAVAQTSLCAGTQRCE